MRIFGHAQPNSLDHLNLSCSHKLLHARLLVLVLLVAGLSRSVHAQDAADSDQTQALYESTLLEAHSLVTTDPGQAVVLYQEAEELLEVLIRTPEFNGAFLPGGTIDVRPATEDNAQLKTSLELIGAPDKHPQGEVVTAYKFVIGELRQNGRQKALINTYAEAIDFATETEDINARVWFLISLADYYAGNAQYLNSAKRFDEARVLIDQSENIELRNQIRWNQRFANLKNITNEPDQVVIYSLRALELLGSAPTTDQDLLPVSCNEIAHAYHRLDVPDKAIPYFNQSIDLFTEQGDIASLGIARLNLARVHLGRAHYTDAIPLLQAGLANTLSTEINWASIAIASRLSESYEALGDYKNALIHEKISKFYVYYVRKQQAFRESRALEAEFEMADNKKRIAEQQDELAEVEAEKAAQRTNALIGGTFLSVLLLITLIYSRNVRRKSRAMAAQQQIIEAKNAELHTSLKQNQVLLKEVHHRVKNNLMTLSGIFFLHESQVSNPEERAFLEDCQNRIHNMAMIHQKLYESENMTDIRFEVYCKELVDAVALGLAPADTNINYTIESDPISFGIDRAVPIALMLTELVTNSFKYAFEGRTTGEIAISLRKQGNQLKLVYTDDGPGLPTDFSVATTKTLGLRLVRILAEQIDASLEYTRTENAQFVMVFEE